MKGKNTKIKELAESVDYLWQMLQNQDKTVRLFDEVSKHNTLETHKCEMILTSAWFPQVLLEKLSKVQRCFENQLIVFPLYKL